MTLKRLFLYRKTTLKKFEKLHFWRCAHNYVTKYNNRTKKKTKNFTFVTLKFRINYSFFFWNFSETIDNVTFFSICINAALRLCNCSGQLDSILLRVSLSFHTKFCKYLHAPKSEKLPSKSTQRKTWTFALKILKGGIFHTRWVPNRNDRWGNCWINHRKYYIIPRHIRKWTV